MPPSWETIMGAVARNELLNVFTSTYCVVTNASEVEVGSVPRVEVQPLGQRLVWDPDDRKAVAMPWTTSIPDVPVAFPGGAAGGLYADVSAGQFGILLWSMYSLDEIKQGQEDAAPTRTLTHDMQDGVFIPLTRSPSQALTALQYAAGAVTLQGDDVRLGDATATDRVPLDSLLQQRLQQIYDALTLSPVAAGDGGLTYRTAIMAALDLDLFPAPTASTKVKAI